MHLLTGLTIQYSFVSRVYHTHFPAFLSNEAALRLEIGTLLMLFSEKLL